MPRGGKREGAGRKKGSPSPARRMVGATLTDLAKEHTDVALAALVKIATRGKSEAAIVSAANALLDRGYGRPRQEHTGAGGGPIAVVDLSKLTSAELAAIEPILSGLAAAAGTPPGASTH